MAKKVVAAPTAVQLEQALKNKFARLAVLQGELAAMKTKYQEHDTLMTELLPMFITPTEHGWDVRRTVTIGNKTYHFTPGFLDPKTGTVVAKQWKSAAHSSGTIQA